MAPKSKFNLNVRRMGRKPTIWVVDSPEVDVITHGSTREEAVREFFCVVRYLVRYYRNCLYRNKGLTDYAMSQRDKLSRLMGYYYGQHRRASYDG